MTSCMSHLTDASKINLIDKLVLFIGAAYIRFLVFKIETDYSLLFIQNQILESTVESTAFIT